MKKQHFLWKEKFQGMGVSPAEADQSKKAWQIAKQMDRRAGKWHVIPMCIKIC